MKKTVILFLFSLFLATPVLAESPEVMQDSFSFPKAKVLEVVQDEMKTVPGTDIESNYQTTRVEILEGPQKGKVVDFTDDYINLQKGDIIFVRDMVSADTGQEYYSIEDFNRLPLLLFFALLFVVLVVSVGGWQGVRGLVSLFGSLALILYVLIPGILQGYSPILVSIFVSSFIIVLGSYVTHGFNKTTSSAVLGMIVTVVVTGLLAFFAVHMGRFTGYGSEEAVYVNLNARGHIDLVGILLGGIMIGLLGVLYDVAIGQAIFVEELHRIATHVPRHVIFTRALRMGREHIGALVNTLAIAYVGAALPLLLLFSQTVNQPLFTLNRELFAEEIIRTLIGSIGLVLAVPITTLFSVLMLIRQKNSHDPEALKKEKAALSHINHLGHHH